MIVPWTECDEIAESCSAIEPQLIHTRAEAAAYVTATMGPPVEIGYQMHDNLVDAVLARRARDRGED